MLEISTSNGQSQDNGHLRRRNRRAAGIVGGIAILLATAGGVWALRDFGEARKTSRVETSRRPPPLPQLKPGFLPIAPAKAEEVNAGIALSTAPIELSRPFNLPAVTATNFAAQQSAVDCLTAAVYYEAASEAPAGQRAVAQVVLNRVRHPAYPKSVCGVVYEGSQRRTGCQFSFTCDGSLARKPSQSGWSRARGIAFAALAGYVEPSVGTATHYHATYVVPYWAFSLDKVAFIGAHIFYRWRGFWGRRAAFTGAYAGEPVGDGRIPLISVFDENDAVVTEGSSVPLGPRPLADDLGKLDSGPAPSQPAAAPLRADQDAGTLTADDKTDVLALPGHARTVKSN